MWSRAGTLGVSDEDTTNNLIVKLKSLSSSLKASLKSFKVKLEPKPLGPRYFILV
jgi:hypothetical protein